MLKTWEKTAIIFDVLGNVEKLTSMTRTKKFNNKIIKFSPSEEKTDRYNFLSEIRLLTKHEKNDVYNIAISFVEDFYGFSNENLSLSERKKLEVENDGPGSRMFLFEEVTRKPDESLFLEIDFKKNIKIKKVIIEKNEKL